MKPHLTLGEKLKDLRNERKMRLANVAGATGFDEGGSPAADEESDLE